MALTCTTPQIPKHAIWHSTKWSVLSNEKCLFSLFLLAYCVLINRVRVEAQFKPTLRGGVPMNLLRNCELRFVCVVIKWQCSLIQITRKKSSLASLLNHSLKEIITSQNLTFLFHQLTQRICQILILAIRKVAKKMNKRGTRILVQLLWICSLQIPAWSGTFKVIQPLTCNLMFKNSNFDGIAEEINGYAQKEMDPAWCKTDAEEVKAFFTLNILLGIKQRYPVKSPTVQLANANLLTCKIKWRCQRVGLQSSTTY